MIFILIQGVVTPTLTNNLDEMIEEAKAINPAFVLAPEFVMVNAAGDFVPLDQLPPGGATGYKPDSPIAPKNARAALERSIVNVPPGRYEIAAVLGYDVLSVRLFDVRKPQKSWGERYAFPLILGGVSLLGAGVAGIVLTRKKSRR